MNRLQITNISRRNRILRDFVAGLILSAALAGAWYVFGKTFFGEGLKRLTYEYLQRRLVTEKEPPVTLVDISKLAPEGPDQVTPRSKLKTLLTALAVYKPKVIGVDIDFSPEVDAALNLVKFMSNEDPAFFAFCVDGKKSGVLPPIYLGISRTQALPPAFWLGLPEYAGLAAAIIAREDPRSVARFIGEKKGPTMSQALSREFLNDSKTDLHRPFWPLENISDVKLSGGTLQESPVDYSMIQRLKDRCIRIDASGFANSAVLKTALDPRADDLYGKMVLVGDVPLSRDDIFDNPAGPGSLPGIILHASAAYTHTVARPLSVMNEHVAPFADFFLAAALLAIVMVVRLSSSPSPEEEKLLVSLSWGLGVAVLAFGIFVNLHRVLWDDCVVVALALFSHPSADRWFGKYWHWLNVPSAKAEQEIRH